jgi:Nuclease-related domain
VNLVITSSYLLGALAVGGLLGYGLGRYRTSSFQNRGEALVSERIQANFNQPDFHLLSHITLKLKDGTTQIDHILVSRFGVFVIETKDYNGWIFANAKHAKWTQVVFGHKYPFQNPLFQNMRHMQAVSDLLDFLPVEAIKPIVVFVGRAEFKTDRPTGVFTIDELTGHLKSQTKEVMSQNRMQFCVGRLETARLAVTGQTDLEHVESLQRRHGLPRPPSW